MKNPRRKDSYSYAALKLVKVAVLVLLSYLLQVSVMPLLKVLGVVPNLLMVCVAILTVSYGKKYAFVGGAAFGILLECMSNNLSMLNLVIYPALSLLCAQVFADMSDIKRELRRIRIAQRQADKGMGGIKNPYQRKRFNLSLRRMTAEDLEPHLRILLNALTLTMLFEVVMTLYFALNGVRVSGRHITRLLSTLLYTALISLLMYPARAFLGMYQRRRKAAGGLEAAQSIDISDKALGQIALVPDLPPVKQTIFAPLDEQTSAAEEAPPDQESAAAPSAAEEKT
ncbi:MAG: hypothetical protein AB9880_00455 [Christensenellales bacterium]